MSIAISILAVIGGLTVIGTLFLLATVGYFIWSDELQFGETSKMESFRVACGDHEVVVQANSVQDAIASARAVWLSETFMSREEMSFVRVRCLGHQSPADREVYSDGLHGPGND